MNGTVSYVKDNLEGTSSVAGEHIITVMDDSECTFVQADRVCRFLYKRSDGGNENQWYFWELFCYSYQMDIGMKKCNLRSVMNRINKF